MSFFHPEIPLNKDIYILDYVFPFNIYIRNNYYLLLYVTQKPFASSVQAQYHQAKLLSNYLSDNPKKQQKHQDKMKMFLEYYPEEFI